MKSTRAVEERSHGALRLRDCYAFFLPLVLMVELNMISKSVIHAFLARSETPSIALAAFSAAFTLYFALTSATEITSVICLTYMKAKRDVGRLLGFMVVILLIPASLALAIAFTDLGDTIFGDWFGLGAKAREEAQACVGFLTLSIPVLLLRGSAFALLMLERRTSIITCSTFVRLSSLGVSLTILPYWVEGAAVGAAALTLCIASETVFACLFAWRAFLRLPTTSNSIQSFRSYWRFSWPLIVNVSAEMGVILVINLFLGRLSQAELAIAAFGVVHGLVSLLMGPMRNLTQSAQALVSRREDVRVILAFTAQLIALSVLSAILLFNTQLNDQILGTIMGLPTDLAAYCEPALNISFVMAAFWSLTALFRGLLATARTTTSLAASGILRIVTAAVAGAVSIVVPDINGAVLGLAAWVLSYVVETAISAWRLAKIGWYVEPNLATTTARSGKWA